MEHLTLPDKYLSADQHRLLGGWRDMLDDIRAWRFIVEPAPDFLAKTKRVLDILRTQLPECCRQHQVPDVDGTNRREEHHG